VAKDANQTIEKMYLKEKKKSTIFLLSTVVMTVLFVGSIFIKIPKVDDTNTTPPTNTFGNPDTEVRGFGQPTEGRMFGGAMMDIESLFNDDGSVNTDAVNDIEDRLPSGMGASFLEARIDQEIEDGNITQAQADALKTELEED
jgi:hypothetical protein